MPDPVISLQGLIYAGITFGALIAGYKAQGLRRKNGNGKPLTEEKHELICEGNLLKLEKSITGHITKEVGKLYEAIKEAAR
jgi:hypothetical protein